MIAEAALRGVPLFDGLKPEARAVLAARAVPKRYATGQRLFRAGDPAGGLLVVMDGRVRVSRQTIGRGQVVHVEGPGGTLGEVPLFAGESYPATATATEPTLCLLFGPEAVHGAIAADPDFAIRLLARLALRLREVIGRLDRLAFTSVRARLGAWIQERARATSGPVISLGLTQTALAEELGTVREVVVKELAELRRAGVLVARGAGRVEVKNAKLLASLISGDVPSIRPARAPGGARRGARRRSGAR